MSKIIKHRSIVDDAWTLLRLDAGQSAATVTLPAGPVIVPLVVWQERRAELASRPQRAVWLAGNEGPELLGEDLAQFDLIAIDFPKFADGRGYSIARLLRERYDYQGEVRAIGDVLRDQLFFMSRVGFDAFAVRADKDIDNALTAFADFPDAYQTGVDQPLPLFRRSAA